MDGFWEAIADVNVDIDWLVKTRTHLDKIGKEQAKFKWKKLTSLPRNSHRKRMVFEQFDEHLLHFQFKSDFFFVFVLQFSMPTIGKLIHTCYDE